MSRAPSKAFRVPRKCIRTGPTKRAGKRTVTLGPIMINRIKGRDPVDFARQLGIMATHTNDRVGQELAALRAQTFAVVTGCGILETPNSITEGRKMKRYLLAHPQKE